MLKFVKLQLGQDWVAEPNAPGPQVSVEGSSVNVRFRSYRPVHEKADGYSQGVEPVFEDPSEI